MRLGVPPVGPNLGAWANDLRRWLERSWGALTFKGADSSAAQDGLMLWDAAGYPVVSKSGEWRQIVLADGYAVLRQSSNVTAAAPNTAYKIGLSLVSGDGVTVASGTDVTFEEGGVYVLAFSAQISSSSASAVTFRFWPRVNGAEAPGGTIVATMHNNGASTVVSRTILATFAAGDALAAMWAVDSTSGFLEAHAATAYAPASPSVTLSVSRVRQ